MWIMIIEMGVKVDDFSILDKLHCTSTKIATVTKVTNSTDNFYILCR